jgi:hypothetical protein
MKKNIIGMRPNKQSNIILIVGIVLTFFILYGLTNRFNGVEIPTKYHIMIGK